MDSSESSSDEGSEKDTAKVEVEDLTKILNNLIRENRELEVSFRIDLIQHLFVTRASFLGNSAGSLSKNSRGTGCVRQSQG